MAPSGTCKCRRVSAKNLFSGSLSSRNVLHKKDQERKRQNQQTWQMCHQSLCSPSSHLQGFQSILHLHQSQLLWLSGDVNINLQCIYPLLSSVPVQESLYIGLILPWKSKLDQGQRQQVERDKAYHWLRMQIRDHLKKTQEGTWKIPVSQRNP